MKISITGGSGFLGQTILQKIAETDHSGKILSHQNSIPFVPKNFTTIDGDVRNRESLQSLCAKMDAVIHCASHISIRDHSFPTLVETNVTGVKNLLEIAAQNKVRRFIHISSTHAYDNHSSLLLTDQSPLVAPNEMSFCPPYDATKMEAQKLVAQARENFPDLETIILVPSGIIGPPCNAPLSLMGKVMHDMYTGKLPARVNGGYHFLDVRDVATMIFRALTAPAFEPPFLLSSEFISISKVSELVHQFGGASMPLLNISLRHLAPWIGLVRGAGHILGKEPIYTHSSLFALSSTIKEIDCTRARNILGFDPRPLRESIQDTVEAFAEGIRAKESIPRHSL